MKVCFVCSAPPKYEMDDMSGRNSVGIHFKGESIPLVYCEDCLQMLIHYSVVMRAQSAARGHDG